MILRTLLSKVKLQHHETVGHESPATRDSDDPIRECASSQPRWYLVHCKARQDERALEHLERQGFECYRPVRQSERIRHGRQHLASTPLFPGYLFIKLDRIHDNWLPIRSTRGVLQIVRFNDYPLPIRDGIIEAIRRRIDCGLTREPYLKPGERVLITKGCLSGIEAIFIAGDGEERVMLLLSILQSDQTLSFPIESVRKLGRDGARRISTETTQ